MAKIDHDIDNQNSKYHRHIETSYFHVCAGKSVLEIGPSKGTQTPCIINNNPSSLTSVEANVNACRELTNLLPDVNVINQDIFEYYKEPHKMDVVICCGVLYHLHSPFHLLELIVNQSDPEYLVLDCVDNDTASDWLVPECKVGQGSDDCTIIYRDNSIHAVTVDQEPINHAGMRQVAQEKNVMFSVIFHTALYRRALEGMGYQILKLEKLGKKFKTKTKYNNWIGLWKKI
jgi:hypothetical protein